MTTDQQIHYAFLRGFGEALAEMLRNGGDAMTVAEILRENELDEGNFRRAGLNEGDRAELASCLVIA